MAGFSRSPIPPDGTARSNWILQADTGLLRTVFVYPWTMTWKDCLHQWGARVNSTEVSQGRVFYSYLGRKLDVLVDSAGKVISFGLY